ncbi:hypothetical protein CALCODRAFT_348294 [Calocera cornea HHB12733]|uniref:Uncharacterized protein n=1 Tax=Calocera cornea HHB12733 TaxID=1353952 RepID=A0A165JCX8_9BASI|nr:hypothetical protein CALCODRAFT_348294 [Calocera cornea HHB12733]
MYSVPYVSSAATNSPSVAGGNRVTHRVSASRVRLFLTVLVALALAIPRQSCSYAYCQGEIVASPAVNGERTCSGAYCHDVDVEELTARGDSCSGAYCNGDSVTSSAFILCTGAYCDDGGLATFLPERGDIGSGCSGAYCNSDSVTRPAVTRCIGAYCNDGLGKDLPTRVNPSCTGAYCNGDVVDDSTTLSPDTQCSGAYCHEDSTVTNPV